MGYMLKRWQVLISPFVLVGVLSIFLFSSGGVEAATSTGCGSWSVVSSPNVQSEQNFLQGVTAITTNDVWSVGFTYDSSGNAFTLTEQWNDTKWNLVASPNTSATDNFLYGVAGVSTNNVWAVGATGSASQGPLQTMIEHWNGTQWSIVSSPNSSLPINQLRGVTAISSSDIWAVGSASVQGGATNTLIEHWNGKKWKIVASPNTTELANYLYSVTAITANNIWTVGSAENSGGSAAQSLIEHWDGTQWSIVASPNVLSLNILNGVSAVSAKDIWTVGYTINVSGTTTQTLIEQWNGSKWKIVSGPHPTGENDTLNSVVAISASDVWAVGNAFNTGNATSQALIEQWNGTKWKIVASPNPSPDFSVLNGIAALSVHAIWSVGDYLNTSGSYQTLTEYYC